MFTPKTEVKVDLDVSLPVDFAMLAWLNQELGVVIDILDRVSEFKATYQNLKVILILGNKGTGKSYFSSLITDYVPCGPEKYFDKQLENTNSPFKAK